MNSLVIEFQKQITDNSVEVSDLIRSCLIIATKLKNKDIKEWLNKELYGYEIDDEIPQYRLVPMSVKFFNPHYGWCPYIINNSKFNKVLSEMPLRQKISELYEMSKSNNSLLFDTPFSVKKELLKEIPFESDINYVCNPIYIKGIIDTIKSKMLEWILSLEENDIVDTNYIFNKDQILKSKEISSTIINNFYGDKNKIDLKQEIAGD